MILLLANACNPDIQDTGKKVADSRSEVNSGQMDTEPETGVDSDTAAVEPDRDGDGSPDEVDCAPDDAGVGTTISERFGNGVDDDCDGTVDEALTEEDADASMYLQPIAIVGGMGGEQSVLVARDDEDWFGIEMGYRVYSIPVLALPGSNAEVFPEVFQPMDAGTTANISNAGDLDGDGIDDVGFGLVQYWSTYEPPETSWTGAIPGTMEGTPFWPSDVPWLCTEPEGQALLKVGDGLATPFVTACQQGDAPRLFSLYARSAFDDGEAREEEALSWIMGPSDLSLGYPVFAPFDLDGDGLDDLGFGLYDGSIGGAGRIDLYLAGSILPGGNEVPDVTIETASYSIPTWAFADIDGDGHCDLVYGDYNYLYDEPSDSVTWRVFPSIARSASWVQAEAYSWADPTDDGLDWDIAEVRNMGDRDGDGRDDILFVENLGEYQSDARQDAAFIMPGSALSQPGLWTKDQAIFLLEGSPDAQLSGPFVDADVDGSGFTDLILSAGYNFVDDEGIEQPGSAIFYDPGVW